MLEAEVKPPAPSKLGYFSVFHFLMLRFGVPGFLLLLVTPSVIDLCAEKDSNGQYVDNEEISVASVVKRLIVVSIYEVAEYAA